MASDVHAVADAAHAVDPLLVGHSLGGAVVSTYAAGFPTRGVVNIEQSMQLGAFKDALTSIEGLLRGDEASFRAVMEQIVRSNYGPLAANERARIEAGGSLEQDVVLGVWDLVLTTSAPDLNAQVEAALRAITAPYLSLHGADPGPDYPEWLQRNIARSTVEVWPDHGHFPHLVEPERFLERLHDFAHGIDAP
jgi:pimeloyl-ACP methyl ester carboxylesterase